LNNIFITNILTYNGAWDTLNLSNKDLILDITESLKEIVPLYREYRLNSRGTLDIRNIWDKHLVTRSWSPRHNTFINPAGERVNVRNLGPIKNRTSVAYPFMGIDFVTKWLFNLSTIAFKNDLIDVPILLIGTRQFHSSIEQREIPFRQTFEDVKRQLELLSPLNHPYPFLVLGFGETPMKVQVIEVKSSYQENNLKVIDRSIEFPPEYHIAGLNILNFFGTYLREQYPSEDAKVRIEQDGLIVRLIVESQDGRSEVIEKALHEYQLIVTGQQPPESILNNEKLVFELRNELRFAKLRIETQQDLIGLHQGQIDKLLTIVATALEQKPSINIDFKPTITTTHTFTINQDMSKMISDINHLKAMLAVDDPLYRSLKELEDPLIEIQKETDPRLVKNSSAMGKIKDLLDKVTEGSETIEKSINFGKKGWELFKELASNYNKVAQWCGLPIVPTIFTK
jgi:hypothetical protein